MTSNLGSHFRAARLSRGLTLQRLARLTGYADARKVAARIARFEADGIGNDELVARLADALDIDYPTVECLLALDGADPVVVVVTAPGSAGS